MFRVGIFTVLCSVAICSFGFTMNRSELIESTWDTAPSLDTYQRTRVDPVANDKIQMTDTHGISQVPNTRVSEKLTEESVPENSTRERRSEIITNSSIGLNPSVKSINNTESAIKNDSSKSSGESRETVTRNVILLLIDEKNQKVQNLEWQDYVKLLPSAIEGLFQSCRDEIDINATSSRNMSIIEESVKKDCNCERLLRSNIEELLVGVRDTLGMTTGSVSASDFLILTPFIHKDFDISPGEFRGLRKVRDTKVEVHKSNDESNDAWRMIDLNERAQTVSTLPVPDSKTETVTNYDGMWNIFDVISKIRMAFFRTFLESLRKIDDTSVDESHGAFLKPDFVTLLETTLSRLKSIPNGKGYVLIAEAPRNETAAAIDLLQRQISTKDTLLIVTYPCFGDKKPIPFIAQGPNSKILQETKVIWQLPIVIRKAITSDCYDRECTDRQGINDTTISHMPMPIQTFSQPLLSQHHFRTNRAAVEKINGTNKINDTIAKAL